MPTPSELLTMSEQEYRKYNQSLKENIKKRAKIKAIIKKLAKKTRKNSFEKGIHKLAKGLRAHSIKYSESGRARMISNLSKGTIPKNPLNAPSVYIMKSKKNKLFRI